MAAGRVVAGRLEGAGGRAVVAGAAVVGGAGVVGGAVVGGAVVTGGLVVVGSTGWAPAVAGRIADSPTAPSSARSSMTNEPPRSRYDKNPSTLRAEIGASCDRCRSRGC